MVSDFSYIEFSLPPNIKAEVILCEGSRESNLEKKRREEKEGMPIASGCTHIIVASYKRCLFLLD